MKKHCPQCKTTKDETDFSSEGKKDRNGNIIRRRVCNECRSENRREKRRHKQIKKELEEIKESIPKRKCPLCEEDKLVTDYAKDGHKKKDGTPTRRKYCMECTSKIKSGKITQDELDLARYKEETQAIQETKEDEEHLDKLVSAIVELARADLNRLDELEEGEFLEKTNAHEHFDLVDEDFEELKKEARDRLHDLGFHRPDELRLGKGRYLVVGDSHGKHTKTKMFDLLKSVNKRLDIDKIIHIGHILDDDNIISYWWQDFDNLVVLAKTEEATYIENHIDEGYEFEVIRECVYLGDLQIRNQDLINDYVLTAVGTLDQHLYPKSTIVNCHRHEMDTRCSYGDRVFIASPGALCEKHIVKTIKQIDFTAGYQIREAKPDGFKKYRRMRHMYEYWEQGMLVVEVDEQGRFSIIPCRIHKFDEEYATSYYDKIYIDDRIDSPDKKIFMNTDTHIDLHDPKALHIQDQFVRDYNPDSYVNLGDIQNNKSINHHEMSKGHVITRSLLDESASLSYLMDKMSKWSDDNYLIYGNHERFLEDFYKKYPQLKELLQTLLISPVTQGNYKLIELKNVLKIGTATFIHGDMRMFGQKGSKLTEKAARTLGRDTMVGHLHYSAIRLGCYVIGLSGKYDQEYNEVNASKWVHGFGICNQYGDVNFISNFSINEYHVRVNGKNYESNNDNFWKTPPYTADIFFDFDE